MDPLATLRRLRDSIDARDYTDAVGALNEYYQWRLKGGFEPTVTWETRHNTKGDRYADALAIRLQDLMP
jgi:hypothetical protein